MEKYSKLSFILMLSLLIFITAFAFRERTSPSQEKHPNPEISASGINNSRRPINKDTTKKYLLKLEGNTLVAYHVDSDRKKPVEKAEIEVASLTPEDIRTLETGVYADSAEELFLYFESYTS